MTETTVGLSQVRLCTVALCLSLLASCQPYKFVERQFDCSSDKVESEERSVIGLAFTRVQIWRGTRDLRIINENTGEICKPKFKEFNDPDVTEMPILNTFVDPGTYTVKFFREGAQVCGPFTVKQGLSYAITCSGRFNRYCEVWEGHGGEGWSESNKLMTCARE